MCRTQPTWQAAFVGKEKREADTGLPPSRIQSEVQVSHSVVLLAVWKEDIKYTYLYSTTVYQNMYLRLCLYVLF